MSIRSDAKELGISHSQLSRMLSGKRQWTPDLYEKYNQLQLGTTAPEIPLDLAIKTLLNWLDTQEVTGSSPVPPTIMNNRQKRRGQTNYLALSLS